MKKITLFCLFAIIAQISIAQCDRTGTLIAIDDPGAYPVTGTSVQTFLTDGTKQLHFADDFETVQGIELRVFLSTTERLSDANNNSVEVTTEPLQDDNGGQDMGDPITGSKTFDIPNNVAINDYNYVIIQCVVADVLWGRATLSSPTGNDCNVLSINANQFTSFNVTPNPARNIITLSGIATANTQVEIYDVLGNIVFKEVISNNETIDVSSFNSGMYLISIATKEKKSTKKLLIQ